MTDITKFVQEKNMQNKKEEIHRFLKNVPEGASVSEIARQLSCTRATVAKYLEVLFTLGTVSCREVGKAKIWYFVKEHCRTVLVVAKDRSFISLMQYVLGPAGYKVLGAEDGGEALEAMAKEMPGLMILRTGFQKTPWQEICSIIKKNPFTKELPIMVISGKSQLAEKIRATEMGVDDFVQMPFDINDLKERIKSYFQKTNYSRNAVTNLPNKRAALRFFNENSDRIVMGMLINLIDYKAYVKRFGLAKFNELLRILSQVIQDQTTEFDQNCYPSHINEGDFFVFYHLLSKEEAQRCCDHIISSFKELFKYLSAYKCPAFETRVLNPKEIKELF